MYTHQKINGLHDHQLTNHGGHIGIYSRDIVDSIEIINKIVKLSDYEAAKRCKIHCPCLESPTWQTLVAYVLETLSHTSGHDIRGYIYIQ